MLRYVWLLTVFQISSFVQKQIETTWGWANKGRVLSLACLSVYTGSKSDVDRVNVRLTLYKTPSEVCVCVWSNKGCVHSASGLQYVKRQDSWCVWVGCLRGRVSNLREPNPAQSESSWRCTAKQAKTQNPSHLGPPERREKVAMSACADWRTPSCYLTDRLGAIKSVLFFF